METWIKEGSSLLLITDHYPWGAAAQPLAKRLGVGMSQGRTLDRQNSGPSAPGRLIFTRENELIGNHPIMFGRGPSEQVNRVITFSGQALAGLRGSSALLWLTDAAMDESPIDKSLTPAAGRCQGLAFVHGNGRVVVLGEAGALSAQFDQTGAPFGMNVDGIDNRQLSLNIMHWLSGLIPIDRRAATRKSATSRRPSSRRQAKDRTSKQGSDQKPGSP